MVDFEYSEGHITAYSDTLIHLIPLGAVATWSKLLNLNDVADTVDAIIHKDIHGEPEEDPLTGENIWTEVFAIETHLETVREEEAEKQILGQEAQRTFTEARARGDFGMQRYGLSRLREAGEARKETCPRKWSDKRVREELMAISGGECPESETILAKCQRRTRQLLGVPEPETPVDEKRCEDFTCDVTPHTKMEPGRERELKRADRERFKKAISSCDVDCPPECAVGHLEERMAWLRRRELRYAHQITGRAHDPLADDYREPDPEATPKLVDFDGVLNRYVDNEAPPLEVASGVES